MMMGLVGLFKLALIVLDTLAWPLFAICYPLCASIKAIETKSNSDIQKLITYWVSFSLIFLFERAFEKLLEWLPYWPYIKLMIVSCLVTHNFDGSLYVYKHLVHPCLSVDPQFVINRIIKLKDIFFKEDNLQAEMERYLQENGPDALENLISSQSKAAGTNLVVKEIKTLAEVDLQKFDKTKVAHPSITAVEATQKNDVISASQQKFDKNKVAHPSITAVEATQKNDVISASQFDKTKVAHPSITAVEATQKNDVISASQQKFDKTKVAHPSITAVEATQKNDVMSASQQKFDKTKVAHPSITAVEATQKNDVISASQQKFDKTKVAHPSITAVEATQKNDVILASQVRRIEPNLPLAENKGSSSPEIKEISTAGEAGTGLLEICPYEQVQMQWTCAICQLTAQSEMVLNAHLQGRRHKAACEKLNAKKQTPKSEASFASTGKKSNVTSAAAAATCKDQPGMRLPSENIPKDWTCSLCNMTFKSERDASSHAYGKRHKAACELLKAKVQSSNSKVSPASLGKASNVTEGESEKHASNTATSNKIGKDAAKKWAGEQENIKNKDVEIRNNKWLCKLCNVKCTSQGDMASHLGGQKHLSQIRVLNAHVAGWQA